MTFDDFTAAGRIDARATTERLARRKPILGVVGEVFSPDQVAGLRSAILDLMKDFERREAKYAERRRIERRNRDAIVGGKRAYD